METDYFDQFLVWMLGNLPGDVAANIIAIVTFIFTSCTLILRFWPEPKSDNTLHKLWSIVHLLASFKKLVMKDSQK